MPAGSQWEKRTATLRVKAPRGGTKRSWVMGRHPREAPLSPTYCGPEGPQSSPRGRRSGDAHLLQEPGHLGFEPVALVGERLGGGEHLRRGVPQVDHGAEGRLRIVACSPRERSKMRGRAS